VRLTLLPVEAQTKFRPFCAFARCAFAVAAVLALGGSCTPRLWPPFKSQSSSVQKGRVQVALDALGEPRKQQPQDLKLLWISLDGLKDEDLRDYLQSTASSAQHPFGFRSLYSESLSVFPLTIANPTITSSSHTSTMTCATAAVHGVYANQMFGPSGAVSGFRFPYTTDTFLAALRRSGWKTASAGYPGIDFSTANRSADVGLAYADGSGSSVLQPFEMQQQSDGHRAWVAELRVAHPKATEQTLSAQVVWRPGAPDVVLTWSHGSSTSSSWTVNSWAHLFLDAGGWRERFDVRVFFGTQSDNGAMVPQLYVSQGFRNDVHPVSYKKELDDRRLVFPSGKDIVLLRSLGPQAFFESLGVRLQTMGALAQDVVATSGAQAIFLYFEDLDVIGHHFSGDSSVSALRRAHMAKLDHVLGDLLKGLAQETVVVVTGDHGMSTIAKEFASREFLPPLAKNHLEVRSAGGALFYFARTDVNPGAGARVQSLDSVLLETQRWLEAQRRRDTPEKPLFGAVERFQSSGLSAPSASGQGPVLGVVRPVLAAYASPGVAFVDTVEKPDEKPAVPGQHGHASHFEAMQTRVFVRGAKLVEAVNRHRANETLLNTNLVPLVADVLGVERPEGCRR
jgi:hypothetical protein